MQEDKWLTDGPHFLVVNTNLVVHYSCFDAVDVHHVVFSDGSQPMEDMDTMHLV